MAKVWVLTQGEDHEGGHVLGVYAAPELAHGDFLEAARDMVGSWRSIDQARRGEDGALYAHSGCDWLSLDPYELVGQAAIAA